MKRSVVCISHQTGAGGSEVGRLVAEQLGFRYVDEELVIQAASEGGVEAAAIADEERRKSLIANLLESFGRGGTAEALAIGGFAPMSMELGRTSEDLRALIRQAIEETAARGKAVIVSHAASHAIGGRSDALRVLVIASPKTRADRLREAQSLDQAAAARAIREADANRVDYLKRFHDVGEEQPTQYDLVLNTDHLSLVEAAGLISTAASG